MLWPSIASVLIFSSQTLAEHRRKVIGCEGRNVNLFCEDDKVIRVVRANYGRISSSICANTGAGEFDVSSSWSTRCIQPTSLRAVTSACRGRRSHCSVEVSSAVFGDPCPGTPKYLEVVYTCQRRNIVTESPELPPWLLSLEAISDKIMKKTTTTTSTTVPTTTAISTSTMSDEGLLDEIVVIEDIKKEPKKDIMIRQPSNKFMRYLEMMKQRNEENRISLMLNNPRAPETSEMEVVEQEEENLVAAVAISVVATLILFAAIILAFCCRSSRSKSSPPELDAESTTSSTTYLSPAQTRAPGLPQTVILGQDGKLYQQIFIRPSVTNEKAQFLTNQQLVPGPGCKPSIHEYADINPGSYYNQYLSPSHKV